MFHPTAHCLTVAAMRQCCVPKRSVARSQRTPRRAERRWCDTVVDRVNCATSPRRWLAAEIRRRRSLPTLPSACGPSTLPLALIDIILNSALSFHLSPTKHWAVRRPCAAYFVYMNFPGGFSHSDTPSTLVKEYICGRRTNIKLNLTCETARKDCDLKKSLKKAFKCLTL